MSGEELANNLISFHQTERSSTRLAPKQTTCAPHYLPLGIRYSKSYRLLHGISFGPNFLLYQEALALNYDGSRKYESYRY
jgi:hypothetical protein